MAAHPPSERPCGPGDPAVPEADLEAQLSGIRRSLRARAAVFLAAAALLVLLAGPALLLAPREALLIGVPLAFAIEFALGFALSGKLMALSVTRHHERLRAELAGQQEQARKALVGRWLSLNAEERTGLRGRFPDLDWEMIDRLAGVEGENSTKH